MATAASLRCFCTSVLKSCVRRCRLDGDGGSSTLLLHFGAQILRAQVSPGWRRRRVATLLRTSVLTSCICRCHPDGDGGVLPRCFALRCSNPACAGVAWMATAACCHAASHFGAQIPLGRRCLFRRPRLLRAHAVDRCHIGRGQMAQSASTTPSVDQCQMAQSASCRKSAESTVLNELQAHKYSCSFPAGAHAH